MPPCGIGTIFAGRPFSRSDIIVLLMMRDPRFRFAESGLFVHFLFGRAKENGQPSSSTYSPTCSGILWLQKRSFFCLDTKERTKEKIKAGEKTAIPTKLQLCRDSAELKRMPPCGIPHTIYRIMSGIKYVDPLKYTGHKYSFFNACLPIGRLRSEIFPAPTS